MIELRTHDGIPGGSLRADWDALVDDDPDATLAEMSMRLRRELDAKHGNAGKRFSEIYLQFKFNFNFIQIENSKNPSVMQQFKVVFISSIIEISI